MAVIRSCQNCGRKNRVPAAHLADTGHCGACKAPLPPRMNPWKPILNSSTKLYARPAFPSWLISGRPGADLVEWQPRRSRAPQQTWPVRL